MLIETRNEPGGIRILSLNRPPANAIDRNLLDALAAACDEAANDEAVRAVVLTGSGKFFSAGLDLKALTATPEGRSIGFDFGKNDGVFALWTLPKPTVAMVNGHAIAGGGILTLACDSRLAASGKVKIGLNEVAIGLPFPIGAFEIARLSLTDQQARRVMLDAEMYSPERARELGLVDDVIEPARLEEACLQRARLLGSYSQTAYAQTKRALQQAAVDRVRNESRAQRAAIVGAWTAPETTKILKAQLAGIGKK